MSELERRTLPSNAELITPDDDNDIPTGRSVSLFVGTGGDVEVITAGGQTVVFKNVPDGTFCPISVIRVKDTSTTANDILAIY